MLKTENLQPLVTIIGRLSEQIYQNDQQIQHLSRYVDSKLTLSPPQTSPQMASYLSTLRTETASFAGTTSTHYLPPPPEAPIHHEKDRLRYHLDTKYNLQSIPEQEIAISDNRRVNSLRQDIAKLKLLQRQKVVRNQKLHAVLSEYEDMILTVILPELRQRVVLLADSLASKRTRQLVDKKLAMNREVYQLYVHNVELMGKIVDTLNVLAVYLDSHEMDNLHHQLEVLKNLRDIEH